MNRSVIKVVCYELVYYEHGLLQTYITLRGLFSTGLF